ncbi:MAG: aspartyl protease family protein [Sphingomonas sp.]
MRSRLLASGAALMLMGATTAPDWRPTETLVATGQINAAGLVGTWQSVADLGDGRFATRTDLTVIKSAEIYDGRTHWRIEPSGGSHKLDSPFALRRTRTSAWLARFGWLQSGFGGAGRGAATIRTDDGKSYSVVIATPPGGEPVELWFDPIAGVLARTVEQHWFRKITTRYGDYRSVAGRLLPFTLTRSDGNNEERFAIDGYRLLPAAPADSYAAPRQPDDHAVPAIGTTIAAAIFPQLIIEANINGRPMHFLFDTGGHSILTPDAARSLGLSSVGGARTGGSGAGTLAEQFTRVRELRIGQAVMRNQPFSVIDLGYSLTERGEQPPLAGMLGLEVVERFITRIDYRKGTLTLLPRERPVACRGGWTAARFSDDMPTIDTLLDGIRAPFTIDTGNNGSIMLYAHWLKEHGVAERFNRGIETVSYGAGGASRNWVSYADSFKVGDGTVRYPMVRTSDDKGGVSLSVSEAGNLGTDVLGNYTVTFDYGRSRVCMDYVPGYQPVPINRSGLRTIKTDPETLLISFVNDGGPASQAGLRKNDKLMIVDGKSARVLSGGDLGRTFTQMPGSRVKVRYIRDGQTHDAEIILREMLPLPDRPPRG